MPHPPLPAVPEPAREAAWRALAARLPERPLLFGSLGFASRYKRLPHVLKAYARFGREHPQLAARTAFVVAGQMDGRTRRSSPRCSPPRTWAAGCGRSCPT